ncbi:MAG: AbrB family transcriptional regulator, partial [Phenylobacterium sp.]|nr:AbrB family transcriptional regulator [Phenylobacterium sp.]
MRRSIRLFSAVFLAATLCAGPSFAKSRIKDIVEFEGVRDNMLVGYGLVVGLNGTAPGGIAEMAITAKVLQLGVPVVTAFQVCRLVAVLVLAEPLYRWRY